MKLDPWRCSASSKEKQSRWRYTAEFNEQTVKRVLSGHAEIAACLGGFSGQLSMTGAVITEAMYFVSVNASGPGLLADFVTASSMQVYDFAQPKALRETATLMAKYANVPMDYADAALMLLAEYLGVEEILTLNRRGFSTYRMKRYQPLQQVLDLK